MLRSGTRMLGKESVSYGRLSQPEMSGASGGEFRKYIVKIPSLIEQRYFYLRIFLSRPHMVGQTPKRQMGAYLWGLSPAASHITSLTPQVHGFQLLYL